MNQSVATLKEQAKGIVDGFSDDYIAAKMLAMGILPGSEVKVVRIAPLGGGFYLKIDGQNIAVRVSEAAHILLRTDQ